LQLIISSNLRCSFLWNDAHFGQKPIYILKWYATLQQYHIDILEANNRFWLNRPFNIFQAHIGDRKLGRDDSMLDVSHLIGDGVV
jgi:hypothetical protein